MTLQLDGAIIGAGFFAAFQAEAWNRIAEANIVAVVDSNLVRAHEFSARYQIPYVYSSLAALLLEQPDVAFVDIATRPDTHCELTVEAAQHGCHVICQKPMAPTLGECQTMIDVCRQHDVRLLIHENWRWQPWYRAALRVLKETNLGQPFRVNFRVRCGDGIGPDAYTVQPYFFEMPRLLIYETLVHHLDTIRLFAGEIESVTCQTQRVNPKIVGEDCATIQIQFVNGSTGLIDGNRINGPNPAPLVFGLLEIEATNGTVRIDGTGRVWGNRYGTDETEFTYNRESHGYRGDSVFATQRHLIDSLLNNTKCESEGDVYIQTVAAVEACYRSATTKMSIRPSDLLSENA